jgi:hypothetical protein
MMIFAVVVVVVVVVAAAAAAAVVIIYSILIPINEKNIDTTLYEQVTNASTQARHILRPDGPNNNSLDPNTLVCLVWKITSGEFKVKDKMGLLNYLLSYISLEQINTGRQRRNSYHGTIMEIKRPLGNRVLIGNDGGVY